MVADHDAADLIIERDAPMRAHDGVRLISTVYRCAGAPPRPVLLMRTPYGKDLSPAIHVLDPADAARAGFVVIIQDVRGRYASEGTWRPYESDASDGYAAVEWAASLPYANGVVGMYGSSYQGSVQLAAAAMRPPALRSIAPMLCWSDPANGQTFRGGALELGKLLRWTMMCMPDRLARRIADVTEAERLVTDAQADFAAFDAEMYRPLPLGRHPLIRKYDPGSELLDYIKSADQGRLNLPVLAPPNHRREVPALWIGGWFDAFLGDMIREFQADRDLGLPSELIVGPWAHGNRSRKVGELDFGEQAEAIGAEQQSLQDVLLEWFRDTLCGQRVAGRPVRVFAMGPDRWRDGKTFGSAGKPALALHLTADGGLAEEPSQDAVCGFTYDPDDPAPTVGGPTLMGSPFPAGPSDQSALSQRTDVLLFQGSVLQQAITIADWILADLWVDSSAPCTDFVVRLLDIDPDGRQLGIADGITRERFEPSAGPRQITVDLWATDYKFAAGHRLGVQVTSSSFPRWDRNLNSGEPLMTAETAHIARQSLYVGVGKPSALYVGRR
jgi:putative CocE/NonD family hydrolase